MPAAHSRRWRRDSLFGDGPRRRLNPEQRARFKYLLAAHRRVRRLTPDGVQVGLALLRRLGVDGQLDPTHATIANDAACDESTVRRTLRRMRELGLVFWQRRIVRNGWRTEQTSNAYCLTLPENPPPRPNPCGGQTARQTLKKAFTPVQEPPTQAEIAAAQAALARIRATMEARALAERREKLMKG